MSAERKQCYQELSQPEQAEYYLLSYATLDSFKMAIEVGCPLQLSLQQALERLQMRDWVRLIDVSSVAAIPRIVVRVFRVMPDARQWLETIEQPSDEERETMHQQWADELVKE